MTIVFTVSHARVGEPCPPSRDTRSRGVPCPGRRALPGRGFDSGGDCPNRQPDGRRVAGLGQGGIAASAGPCGAFCASRRCSFRGARRRPGAALPGPEGANEVTVPNAVAILAHPQYQFLCIGSPDQMGPLWWCPPPIFWPYAGQPPPRSARRGAQGPPAAAGRCAECGRDIPGSSGPAPPVARHWA